MSLASRGPLGRSVPPPARIRRRSHVNRIGEPAHIDSTRRSIFTPGASATIAARARLELSSSRIQVRVTRHQDSSPIVYLTTIEVDQQGGRRDLVNVVGQISGIAAHAVYVPG